MYVRGKCESQPKLWVTFSSAPRMLSFSSLLALKGLFEGAEWCNCAGLVFRKKLLINFRAIVMGKGVALALQSLCNFFIKVLLSR